jgi:Uma2 family endonuclease
MAQSVPAKKPATYEDLLRVPDHLVAEILGGELFATPRPAVPHAHTASRLNSALGVPFDEGRGGPGGWRILIEPELHLHDEIVVPDLAGWRRDRLPSLPDAPFLTIAPDWVGEILSPSTERLDRVQKLAIYGREGVRHVWLVNPLLRTVEILQLDQGRWILIATHGGDEDAVTVEPFDAVPLELSRIWPA